jgi:GT2 family glycosyltransferase
MQNIEKGSNVNIQSLRLKHKAMIVDHILRLYGGAGDNSSLKQRGIDYLLSGGDLRVMIDAFRNHTSLPDSIAQPISLITKANGAILFYASNLVILGGETRLVQITIENKSESVWQTSEETPIYLSYHWYHANGSVCVFDGLRTPLASPIPPGERRDMEITIKAPKSPGQYQIEFTMIYEGQYWFEDQGFISSHIPVEVELLETVTNIRLDENYCIDLGQWDAWVNRRMLSAMKRPLPHRHIVPDGATLWICVMAGTDDEFATGFPTTQASLAAVTVSLGATMLIEVIWQSNSKTGTGRCIETLDDLETLIAPIDIVIFLRLGDEIHPDTPAILSYSGAFGTRFTVFDFWFREGDMARPVMLHGADAIHGQACDYFHSRFAVRGDSIATAARTGALHSLRALSLSALVGDVATPERGLLHVPFPLLCASGLSNAKIVAQQRDLVHALLPPPRHQIVAQPETTVTAVICTKDNGHLLRSLVRELLLCKEICDVVIVSNNTSDEHALVLLDELSRNQRCTVLRYDHSFNFSAQCNLGAKHSCGKYLLFINDDVLPVTSDWLTILMQQVESNPSCIAGPLLLYPDQTVQHGGMYIGYHGCAGHAFRGVNVPGGAPMFELVGPRQVSCLTGAVLLMKRELYTNLNGFDQMMATMLQDVDLSLRALFSGVTLVFEPRSILFHMESVSVKTTLVEASVQRRREAEYAYFAKRWASELGRDAWINPNLDIQDETWRTLCC